MGIAHRRFDRDRRNQPGFHALCKTEKKPTDRSVGFFWWLTERNYLPPQPQKHQMRASRPSRAGRGKGYRHSPESHGGDHVSPAMFWLGAAILGVFLGAGSMMFGNDDHLAEARPQSAAAADPAEIEPMVSTQRPRIMAAEELDAQQPSASGGWPTEGARDRAPMPVRVFGTGFPNCRAARAAGAAPMYRGQPGYNPNLDGDADGIACEPFHGAR